MSGNAASHRAAYRRIIRAAALAAAVLALVACGSGNDKPSGSGEAQVTFTNYHAASIEVFWGEYLLGGTPTPRGSFTLAAAGSSAKDLPAGDSFNIWYNEGSTVSYLGSDGSPTPFTLDAGKEYTLSFNANKTYSFAAVSEAPITIDLPPVAYSPTISYITPEGDIYGSRFSVEKGNLWYLPTSKKLYAAFYMNNDNSIPLLISGSWNMEFLDSEGNKIYEKSNYLFHTSTTPVVHTSGTLLNQVFTFSVDREADFYLSGLGSYSYITLGNDDTKFAPEQIAIIRITCPTDIQEQRTSSIAFLTANTSLEYLDCGIESTYAQASVKNNSPSLAFNTTMVYALALNANGEYIGISELYDPNDAVYGVIASGSSASPRCFMYYPGLASIAGLELVPRISYSSGSY